MRKIITLTAAMAVSLAALANLGTPSFVPMYVDEVKNELTKTFVTEAEGTLQYFAASGNINTEMGMLDFAGLKYDIIISDDGTKAYFPSILPYEGSQKDGTYVVGDVSVNDGGQKKITVKSNQLLQVYETIDDYLLAKSGMTLEEYAYDWGCTKEEVINDIIKWTGPRYFYFVAAIEDPLEKNGFRFLDELVLCQDESGVYKSTEKHTVFWYSYLYEGDNSGYDFAYSDISLTPVTDRICVLPEEGVEYREYMHAYADLEYSGVSSEKSKICKVGFKDDKIYIPGFIDGESNIYIEGTINAEKGLITLTSPLAYSESSGYILLRAFGPNVKVMLENDIFIYKYEQEFLPVQLKYDAETGNITLLEDGWIGEYPYGEDKCYYMRSYTFTCLNSLNLANPAAPENLEYEDSYFSFTVPFKDVDGQAIPSGFLSYQIMVDSEDNIFEFTPDDYWIDEPTTEMPVSFSDIDIISKGNGDIKVWWSKKKRPFKDLGVRSVLNLNGEKKYSKVTWLYNTMGIEAIGDESIATGPAFDILGRKVSKDYKGVVIVKGRKEIRQ